MIVVNDPLYTVTGLALYHSPVKGKYSRSGTFQIASWQQYAVVRKTSVLSAEPPALTRDQTSHVVLKRKSQARDTASESCCLLPLQHQHDHPSLPPRIKATALLLVFYPTPQRYRILRQSRCPCQL